MQLKTLLSSVAIFACASSANAADVIKHHKHNVKKPVHVAQIIAAPVMPVAPSSHWAGPYLGFEIGALTNKFHAIYQGQDYSNGLAKPKERPLAGLFAGYNFAIGPHAVLGLDGNIDYHSIESFSTSQDPWGHYKEEATAAARLRLGFAQDHFMPYIAGGFSAVRGNLDYIRPSMTMTAANKKRTYLGWNIGGGIDYALAPNVFLRADYRFSRVKIKEIYYMQNNALHQVNADRASKKSHELRIGAAYKF